MNLHKAPKNLCFLSTFKKRLWFIVIGLGFSALAFSDVRSITGIINFEPTRGAPAVMNLSSTGLRIGDDRAANERLDVSGNALISQQLIVGGGTGQSNLQINGSLGLAAQTVSSNTTIGESSLVFVNTASDNVKITLPYAGNCSGRIYSIKKTSSLHKICIKGGGNLVDLSGCLNLTTSSANVLPYVKLLSDGHQWYDISQSTVSNTVAQSNLVGWWKLDGLSGNTALDSSSSQHHGTTQNGLTFADMPGKICGALEFDGTNDYVSVGDHDAYDFGTGNFTASFWFFRHTNALVNLRAFSKGAGNDTVAEAGFAFYASDTSMVFMVNPSGTRVGAGSTYTANEWHHVVGVARSSANVAIYMDGQLKSVNTIGSGSFSGTAPVNIGCMPNDLYWDGLLDEVRLYNTALSSSEVLSLYLEGL